jgi:hypothetical protein
MGKATTRQTWAKLEKYIQEHNFKSDMDFARFLVEHEKESTRGVEAWRGVVQRWRYANPHIHYNTWSTDKTDTKQVKNYYDKNEDNYVFHINREMVVVTGKTHRAMKRAYSSTGGSLTIEQMARKFKLAPSFIAQYVKTNSWNHAMDIFTDEEIREQTEEELVADAIRIKRQSIEEKVNKKYWNDLSKIAEKYIQIEQEWAKEFKEIISKENLAPKKVDKIKMSKANPYAVVLSPTDLHYGKGSWIEETGEAYTLEEARFRLLDRTNNLISRLPGKPEKIVIATGSDWFHVDNETGTTTAGTPQDMAASPAQILVDGCKLAREHIDMLRTVAPIEVVFMRGNHDRHSALALMLYLDAVYENAKDVTITVSPKLRQYVKWGNNLLGFTHGDGVRGNDLPAIMATEERKSWGEHEHHVWFHGHLHHQRLLETSGVTIIQLPSLAGHDRYHYRKGFVLARAGISAHLIDKDLGLIGNLFAPVV